MKTSKMISLDIDLVMDLAKLDLNVSEYCNEKLWDYVTQMGGLHKTTEMKEAEIDEQMAILNKQKVELTSGVEMKEKMKEAGITDQSLKFLRQMSINIMAVKDNKATWKKMTGDDVGWADLLKLKEEWK